jgi:hypothetical protein
MTATTTTLTAFPTFNNALYTIGGTGTAPTSSISANFIVGTGGASTDWKFLSDANVYMLGQADNSKSPASDVIAWLNSNSAALGANASLATTTKVSSYTIVIDLLQ